MKRWYQLSMLQAVVFTTVVAIFVVKNFKPLVATDADGNRTIASGWPIAQTMRIESKREMIQGGAKLTSVTECSQMNQPWALLMNISSFAITCGIALRAASLVTKKSYSFVSSTTDGQS